MSNKIQRFFAVGIAKKYYKAEDEFEAIGTLYTPWSMHYVAAHPYLGLWLCGILGDNSPMTIGFVKWENIRKIIVDDTYEQVFIVLNDYDEVIRDSYFMFKRIYKVAFTHTFKSEGYEEKAIKLPLNLFSGNILPYLQQRCTLVRQEVENAGSIWPYVRAGLVLVIIICMILKLFS